MKGLHEYGVSRTDPYGIVKSVVGTLSWNLSALFKIKGSNCGFASACASSSHALGFAYDQIALGRQDRIIVTGAEDGDVLGVLPFGIMRALSTSNNPDSASLPFDSRRSGFVGCGGAATIVLESANAAAQRGAQVLAEFYGWGQSSDGYHPAAPIPDGSGLRRAITGALKSSGFKKDSIEYINAHATGTKIGDLAEIRAIKHVFGESPKFPISSTKALTGHGLSYAGILEIALCIRALRERFTPGTANLLDPDPESIGLYLPKDNLESGVRRFLSNSSGFGGANVCLAMQLP
jgi:3-oxoacyl-[acyl-carrier-protein] synthase-1